VVYSLPRLRDTLVVAESTRRSMSANRSVNTKPEIALRTALWHAGHRGYRKNVTRLPGKPDIVFGRQRVAIFIQGCFWHGCPNCTRNLTPKTNALYWATKISQNKARDERNAHALEAAGYRVLVVWECDLKSNVQSVVARISDTLGPC
jgi:DNA mismatch endonuclease (patch repair protein)